MKKLKEKMKAIERSKLDDYSKNVKDNVRLHEPGWKVCNFCIFFMYLCLLDVINQLHFLLFSRIAIILTNAKQMTSKITVEGNIYFAPTSLVCVGL